MREYLSIMWLLFMLMRIIGIASLNSLGIGLVDLI